MTKKTITNYAYDDSIMGTIFNDNKGDPVSITEIEEDGSATTYEYDDSVMATIFYGNKGRPIGKSS